MRMKLIRLLFFHIKRLNELLFIVLELITIEIQVFLQNLCGFFSVDEKGLYLWSNVRVKLNGVVEGNWFEWRDVIDAFYCVGKCFCVVRAEVRMADRAYFENGK